MLESRNLFSCALLLAAASVIVITPPVQSANATTAAAPVSDNNQIEAGFCLILKTDTIEKYTRLAKVFGGQEDCRTILTDFDPNKPWQQNPTVIFVSPMPASPDIVTCADANGFTPQTGAGHGKSAHVEVWCTAVPNLKFALKTRPCARGCRAVITGVLTVNIAYYDDQWVELFPAGQFASKPVTFSVNTPPEKGKDPAVIVDKRFEKLAVETYTRDDIERFMPKSNWPAKPQNGDFRVAVYLTDVRARIEIF